MLYFRHLIIKEIYRATVKTELIRTEAKEEKSMLLPLVVMAAELTVHQREGSRGFLRDLVFVVSPLSYRWFSLFPSAKQNPDVEAL